MTVRRKLGRKSNEHKMKNNVTINQTGGNEKGGTLNAAIKTKIDS